MIRFSRAPSVPGILLSPCERILALGWSGSSVGCVVSWWSYVLHRRLDRRLCRIRRLWWRVVWAVPVPVSLLATRVTGSATSRHQSSPASTPPPHPSAIISRTAPKGLWCLPIGVIWRVLSYRGGLLLLNRRCHSWLLYQLRVRFLCFLCVTHFSSSLIQLQPPQ